MRILVFVFIIFFCSCGDSFPDGLRGEWRAISFESDVCEGIPWIPYNEPDENNCLTTIYGSICDVEFHFSVDNEAVLMFTDSDGSQQAINYTHWDIGENTYSIFKDTQLDGRNWAGRFEGRTLVLGDNPLWLCDVYRFSFKEI